MVRLYDLFEQPDHIAAVQQTSLSDDGDAQPSLETLERLAMALKVAPAFLSQPDVGRAESVRRCHPAAVRLLNLA